jgi:Ctr copper transporter family
MHIVQGLLNLIQLSSGYVLMLIVMTYNVYLCISVLIGSSIGFYLFNPYLKQKRILQTQKTQDPAAENEESGALLNHRDPYQPAIVSSSLNSPDSGQISVVSANVHQSIYS